MIGKNFHRSLFPHAVVGSVVLLSASVLSLTVNVNSATAAELKLNLVGSIDNRYSVNMNLMVKDQAVSGDYHYAGQTASLKLNGTIDDAGKFTIKESDSKGRNTGTFNGALVQNKRIVGVWKKSGTKPSEPEELPFLLALDNDPSALGDKMDGAILQQKELKITKPKDCQSFTPVAVLKFPSAVAKFVNSPKVFPVLQDSLSTGKSCELPLSEIKSDFAEKNGWLDQIDYQVLYNKNKLISLESTISGCGAYPSSTSHYSAISIESGKQLKYGDLFLASAKAKLEAIVRAKLLASAKKAAKDNAISSGAADGKATLESANEALASDRIDLSALVISDKGITFKFDWSFPHVMLPLEPDGDCFLSFAQLAPFIRKDGPLKVFNQTPHK